MSGLLALEPEVRLLIEPCVQEQLREYDDLRFQTFCDAVAFAQKAIGKLATGCEMLSFQIPYKDLELLVTFCRRRERFVVASVTEVDDDPPPGASGARRETLAESLLRVAGIDSSQQRVSSAEVGKVDDRLGGSVAQLARQGLPELGPDGPELTMLGALVDLGVTQPEVLSARAGATGFFVVNSTAPFGVRVAKGTSDANESWVWEVLYLPLRGASTDP